MIESQAALKALGEVKTQLPCRTKDTVTTQHLNAEVGFGTRWKTGAFAKAAAKRH